MWDSRYSFYLSIVDQANTIVHREEAGDFLPCYEDLLFSAVCSGKMANDGKPPRALIEPVWVDGVDGVEGKVAGVTTSLLSLSKSYGLSIFAHRVWEVLVDKGLLKKEEEVDEARKVSWWVEAQKRDEERKGRLSISLSRQPYPLIHSSLSALGVTKPPEENEPFSLHISRPLLDELKEETGQSLDNERADILTGHLVQDEEGKVALIVKGRIPALKDTASSRGHFSFSPLTFHAVQGEVVKRPNGETVVGWHHNHPPPCGTNCLQYIPPCKTSTVFFSTADRFVHRASFPAAYMIALVSGKQAERRANDPIVQAYGWQDGVIRQKELSVS